MRFSVLTLLMLTFLVSIYFGLSSWFPWPVLMLIPVVLSAVTTTFVCIRWPDAHWWWAAKCGTFAAALAAVAWMTELTAQLFLRSSTLWPEQLDVSFLVFTLIFVVLNTFNGLLTAMVVSGLSLGIRKLGLWQRARL